MKEFFFNILRGIVVGLANVIPGVSGGTMMVSMGIYDKLILVLTHFVKRFKEAVAMLVPIMIGMLLAIALFAKLFSDVLFPNFPLQTNLFFIGLILGGLPVIWNKVKGNKLKASHCLSFVIFFALVVVSAIFGNAGGNSADVTLSFGNIVVLFFVGVVAAATMVIPGVSGSMIMMVMGYYDTIINTVSAFISALKNFDIQAMLQCCIVLVPFGFGVLIGIVAVAKLVEFVLKKYTLIAYWAIIGLIVASPIAIILLMGSVKVTVLSVITGILLMAVGFGISLKLGEK